ncbi:MAG: competence/damage-inducible protein A [Deltaproteobacteria bacterium]|nr:competence/damage-inducible protein A [Deltaproteobacteria bacterium]
MKVEIITIGDELSSGSVQDTNATFIANKLYTNGIDVVKITTVGDDTETIMDAFKNVQQRVSFVIVTGGLGPTVDDITTQAASEALRRKLVLNKHALKTMEERFQKYGRTMSPHNVKQAYLPSGSTVIHNPIGTACGFSLAKGNTLFIFLPGVPREMKGMFEETVIPLIKKEHPDTSIVRTRVLKVFGKTESYCDQKLADLIKSEKEITFAFLPRYPEISLKLTMRGQDKKYIEKKLKAVERKVIKILGDIVFGKDEEILEEVVGNLLRSQGATIAVTESCTGGLITHRLTNVPGSSDYLERSLIAYSNKSKKDLLKVPATILNRFGAVSQETAERMAKGVKSSCKATFGLAVTGIAGPAGGTPEKPVGTVFISLAHGRQVKTQRHSFYGNRKQIKFMTSQYALDILRKHLMDN